MYNNCKPRTQGGNPYCPTHQSPSLTWPCEFASNEAIFKFAWEAANARGEQGARVKAGLKALSDANRLLPPKPVTWMEANQAVVDDEMLGYHARRHGYIEVACELEPACNREVPVHWVEKDQRAAAWDRLAQHPLWKVCFDEERPLIDAMMDRMDKLAELEAQLSKVEERVAGYNMCGAPAEDGPCVLPRGHNMGRADVPDNHRTELPGERPWMLPLVTDHVDYVNDYHSVRHRRVKHCSNYPFCAVDPNQNESIPPNVKLNLRHAHGRSHFYSVACIQLGCIDRVDTGEAVSPDESEEA